MFNLQADYFVIPGKNESIYEQVIAPRDKLPDGVHSVYLYFKIPDFFQCPMVVVVYEDRYPKKKIDTDWVAECFVDYVNTKFGTNWKTANKGYLASTL